MRKHVAVSKHGRLLRAEVVSRAGRDKTGGEALLKHQCLSVGIGYAMSVGAGASSEGCGAAGTASIVHAGKASGYNSWRGA